MISFFKDITRMVKAKRHWEEFVEHNKADVFTKMVEKNKRVQGDSFN